MTLEEKRNYLIKDIKRNKYSTEFILIRLIKEASEDKIKALYDLISRINRYEKRIDNKFK